MCIRDSLLTASSQNSQGTVERLETKTASFANTYEPGSHVLTIEKRVSGSMGDHNREFSFSLALARDGDVYKRQVWESGRQEPPDAGCSAGGGGPEHRR